MFYPNSKLLTMKNVSNILSVSTSFAYRLGRQGKLPVVRLGRSVRVRKSDLEEFIKINQSRRESYEN